MFRRKFGRHFARFIHISAFCIRVFTPEVSERSSKSGSGKNNLC